MTIETILSQPAVERIGWALLHFVWQGTAIAILLAVALMLLRNRSANSRYIASCAAMVLMAMVFASTIRTVHVPAPVTAAHESSIEPLAPGEDVQRKPPQAPAPEQIQPLPELGPVPGAVMSVAAPPFHLWQQRLSNLVKPVLPWVVCGWLIGVIILSLRLLGGWARVQYLKRRFVEPVADRWERALAELVERLKVGQKVRLVQSALAQVPTVIGWLRPVILLPASALTGLKPQEIEALIAHELAHIRRYDYLVNLFQTVIETVLFYHPAVWWVSHRIRVERENCCDDIAVAACGDALTYAHALTDLEELRGTRARFAVTASGGSLLDRIRRLVIPCASDSNRSSWLLAGVIAITIVSGSVLGMAVHTSTTSSETQKQSVQLKNDEQVQKRSVWVTLFPRSPIRSLDEYRVEYLVRSLAPEGATILSQNVEIRSASDNPRIAELPLCWTDGGLGIHDTFAPGKIFRGQKYAGDELSRSAVRRIGALADGDYRVAMIVNGIRCSNVAQLKVDSQFNPQDEPTLKLVCLDPGPGQALPYLGVRAIGPTPQDPDLTNQAVAFAQIVVDGVEHVRKETVWRGPVGPIQSGRILTRILDISTNLNPPVERGKPHEVYVKIGPYVSAPITLALGDPLAEAWDKQAPGREPSSQPATKPTKDEPSQPSSAAPDDRLGLSFDGVYDFVEVPDSKLLDIGDEFTLEAWIKVRNAPGERAVVSKEVPWKSGYTLIVREVNDRSCAVTFAIGSGNRFTNLTVPSDNVRGTPPASDSMPGVIEKGKRHHVAATWQRGKVSLFVDGQCVGMNLFPRAVPARAPLMIGQASGGLGRQFDGEIAEVRIWNVARSQKDILNNMHRKLAEKESGLVARWILQKGSGRAVHDMSPNHLDGVVHGSEQVDANPEPTVQRLIAQLKDPDRGARKNAVMQLGELYDLRAVGPLVGAVVKAFLTAIRDGDMETMLPLVVEYPPDWTVARWREVAEGLRAEYAAERHLLTDVVETVIDPPLYAAFRIGCPPRKGNRYRYFALHKCLYGPYGGWRVFLTDESDPTTPLQQRLDTIKQLFVFGLGPGYSPFISESTGTGRNRLVFRGLDLAEAPRREYDDPPPELRTSKVVRIKEPGALVRADLLDAEILYMPDDNIFFVKYYWASSSRLPPYYGPFKGDPFERLHLARPAAEDGHLDLPNEKPQGSAQERAVADQKEVMLDRAEQLYKDKKFDEAIDAYRKIHEAYPDWNYAEHALMMIGICHEKMGRDEEAMKAFEKAIQQYPNLKGFSETTYFYLGEAYVRAGEERKALEAFQKSVELCQGVRDPNAFPYKNAEEWIKKLESR